MRFNQAESCALRSVGVRRTHGGGQKDGHQGFHPFEFRFLLRYHGEICRTETIGERQRIFSSVGAHSVRPFPYLFSMPDTLLLHMRFALRRRNIPVLRNSVVWCLRTAPVNSSAHAQPQGSAPAPSPTGLRQTILPLHDTFLFQNTKRYILPEKFMLY